MMKWFTSVVIAAGLTIAGCAASFNPPFAVDCEWALPIVLSASTIDLMTDEEARQVLYHNEMWEAVCDDVL